MHKQNGEKVKLKRFFLILKKTRMDAQMKTLQNDVHELELKEDRLDKEKRELKKEVCYFECLKICKT